jgi:hypothetical protein
MIIDELRQKLWKGANPLAGFPIRLIAEDSQGWQSQHPFLSSTIEALRPRVVIEIGVWKGGSTLTMAHRLKDLGIDGAVIAVDTWLGAWDHWVQPHWREELCFVNGYPHLFEKFAANVIHHDVQEFVVPLPLDSVNARNVISAFGISADVIHIDGGHDYAAVMMDLIQWWSVLRSGGVFIGDDYNENGSAWPDVFRAVNDFLAQVPHTGFEFHSGKCRVIKA